MKVKGPAFSMEAHGTLDKALTFKGAPERSVCHQYASHRDARTQAQLNQRAHFRDAVSLWRVMTEADRLLFGQTYQLPHMTPFAVWTQYILKRETVGPNWLHPNHQGKDINIAPFDFIIPYEQTFGPYALDISGSNHPHDTSGATIVQGDRDNAIKTDENRTGEQLYNSVGLGDRPAFTFGYLFLPDRPQSDSEASERHLWARSDGTNSGHSITIQPAHCHWRINGKEEAKDLDNLIPWTPGKWNSYLYRFDGTDSGRMQIWLNGRLVAEQTTGISEMNSNTFAYSIQNDPWNTYAYGTFDLVFQYRGATPARTLN